MAMNELLLSLRKKYMCIHTKSIFSHHSVIILFFLMPLVAKGQYQVFDSNSANAVLEANAEYIRAYGQMTQRAIQIRHAVQPYREMMIQTYRKGCYKEALDICYNANKQYVYYVFDNKGMSDMELLAGECAVKMQNYELAITWYNMAKAYLYQSWHSYSHSFAAVLEPIATERCQKVKNVYLFQNLRRKCLGYIQGLTTR